MKNIYIVSAKRTGVASFLGALKDVPLVEFSSAIVKEMIKDSGVDASKINEVIVGNVLPAGQKQGIARQVSIASGLDQSIPAYSINMVCGSGMKAVMNGCQSIAYGAELVLAGGVESMSQAPYLIPGSMRNGRKMGAFETADHMLHDALLDAFEGYHMGITAENIVSKYNLTREEQDAFAFSSQEKARKAQLDGKFKDEIVPVVIKTRKGEVVFAEDEYINHTTTLEKLSSLRPAFKKDGSVTAGNSSGINDGASFVLLASEEALSKYNLKPIAKIVGIGQGGVDPLLMGLGPIEAVRNALVNANLSLKDMDLLELNEAFAAQALGVVEGLVQEHGVDKQTLMNKTNVNGGAIAIGHPVGASGNRILVTLLHEMQKQDVTYGLASLCIGGGMGTAVIVERM